MTVFNIDPQLQFETAMGLVDNAILVLKDRQVVLPAETRPLTAVEQAMVDKLRDLVIASMQINRVLLIEYARLLRVGLP